MDHNGHVKRSATSPVAALRSGFSRTDHPATRDSGQVEAARRLGISPNRLNEIVLGKRGIAADTALCLARLLKTLPQFWIRLQADWDLHEAMRRAARKAS